MLLVQEVGHAGAARSHAASALGANKPVLAKLVASAAPLRCSNTVTSAPRRANSHAVVIPATPAPMTATFTSLNPF